MSRQPLIATKMADAPPLKVSIPLYEDFDSLDVIGPYQMFTFAGMDLYLLGPMMESVRSFEGIALMPRATFAASTEYDMASKSTRTHQRPPDHQVSEKTVPQRLKPHVEGDLWHGLTDC